MIFKLKQLLELVQVDCVKEGLAIGIGFTVTVFTVVVGVNTLGVADATVVIMVYVVVTLGVTTQIPLAGGTLPGFSVGVVALAPGVSVALLPPHIA